LCTLQQSISSWIFQVQSPVTAEDGSGVGVSVTTEHASVTLSADGANIDLEGDLKERFEVGITWAKRIKKLSSRVAAGEVGKAFDIIKEGISDLTVAGEMYLYLVDELTGEPVRADGWPLIITKPADLVPKLLPLMQSGFELCASTMTMGQRVWLHCLVFLCRESPKLGRKVRKSQLNFSSKKVQFRSLVLYIKRSKEEPKRKSPARCLTVWLSGLFEQERPWSQWWQKR